MSTYEAAVEERPAGSGGRAGRTAPVWWLVARQELIELWLGGRLLVLLILYAMLMSVTAVLRQIESEVSLIPPAEMVFLTVLSTISFGMFLGLIAGADSVSGERDRATLEPLLLTPVGRRQIVFGKFVAALSPWPVALLICVPYAYVLGQGDDSLLPGLAWTAVLGTLLAIAFTGFGMLTSIWSGSNRTSLFVSLLVYLLFVIPTQFPGQAQKGNLGYLVQQLNPMQASSAFTEKLIVNNRTPVELAPYLVTQWIAAAAILVLLFGYAAPRLKLEGEGPRFRPPSRRARGAAGAVIGGALILGVIAMPLTAMAAAGATSAGPRLVVASSDPALTITTDLETAIVDSGDDVKFTTTVSNSGATDTPELNVAMNLINLGKGGDPVDPEDWSPERTQELGILSAGDSSEQEWLVTAILEGDYMIYMTVVPTPESPETTSQPVSSSGIHLTVNAVARGNPGGVLPVAIGVPLILVAVTLLMRRWWNRERTPTRKQASSDGPT